MNGCVRCVFCRPPSPRPSSRPPRRRRVLVILFPQRGFWPPLTIPFPSLPCPPFHLGNMVPHPAVTSQSPVFSCYRSVRVCSGCRGRGGETTTYACPGVKAGRGWSTTTTGWLFLILPPLWPFLFVFPRVNSDQVEIRLPAIIVGSS